MLGAEITNISIPGNYGIVKEGDIITGLDNIEIHNSDEFYCFLAAYYNAGDIVTLTLVRGEEMLTRALTLIAKP